MRRWILLVACLVVLFAAVMVVLRPPPPTHDFSRADVELHVGRTGLSGGFVPPEGRCLVLADGTTASFDGTPLVVDPGSQESGFGWGPHVFGPWVSCHGASLLLQPVPSDDGRATNVIELVDGTRKGRLETRSLLEARALVMHATAPILPGDEITIEALPRDDTFVDKSLFIYVDGKLWVDLADPTVRYSANVAIFPAPTSPPGGHFELYGTVHVRVERCEGFKSCSARMDVKGDLRLLAGTAATP
jgi:hypothetical protein